MSDIAMAEQLWARAHDNVKRGDFAQAVRELAQSFQILQTHNDPRVYEVHRRWTEVHQMYLEDGAREAARPQAAHPPSLEAEAEAAANAGDLARAIALYEQADAERPGSALVRERLGELRAAQVRANDLVTGRSEEPRAATQPPASVGAGEDDWSDLDVVSAEPIPAEPEPAAAQPKTSAAAAAEDDWSDIAVDDSQPPVQAASVSASVAPAMRTEDAPVGMQSLDVPFSVGDAIGEERADVLPVQGAPSVPPAAVQPAVTLTEAVGPEAQVALLRGLLERVQQNRRAVA